MGVVGEPTALLLWELKADAAEVDVLRSVGERREREDVLAMVEVEEDEDFSAAGCSTTIVAFVVRVPSEDEALGCGDGNGRGDEAIPLQAGAKAKEEAVGSQQRKL